MMTEQSNLDADTSATNVEGNSSDNLLVAQAETSAPPADLSSATSGAEAGSQIVIELADGPILELPAGASIDQQRQVGVNLEFVQPDGSVIVVPNGAVQGLTIFIGDVEIPPLTVAALFEANGIQAAAGPSTPGAGHTWEQDVPGIGEAGQAFGGLLGPSTGPQLTALLGRTPDAANLPPQFGGPSYTNVSEEGLREGNLDDAGAGDTTNAVFTTGDLGAIDPNGEPLTFTFGQPTAGLTSNGLPITWTGVGGQVLTGSTPDGFPAIIATVVNGTSGEYTVSLVQPLDHPVAGIEDSIDLILSITADDGQGGTATTELTITIEDDSPLTVKADTAILDEDGLDTINAIGIGDTADGDAIGNDVSATGDLGILWGADRGDKGADITNPDGSFAQDDITAGGRAVYFTNASVVATGTLGGALTSDSLPISFAVDATGTTLVGTVAGGRVILQVSLSDDDAGHFKAQLFDNLDHAVAGTEDDINLTFNYTARDADGDTVDGTFAVTVDDDMPTAAYSGRISVAENAVGGVFETQVGTGNFVFDGGGDGAKVTSITYSMGAAGSPLANDPDNIGFTTVPLTSGGQPVTMSTSPDGLTLTATATIGGTPTTVFTVHVDDVQTGAYTFTQLAPIDHPDVGETGAADPLRLKVGFTVTDGDGDTASNSIQIDILDDAPTAAYSGRISVAENAVGGVFETQVGTGNFVFDGGGDGAKVTSITYSMGAAGSPLANDPDNIGFTTVPLTSGGQPVTMSTSPDGLTLTATATIGGTPTTVFTVHVDDVQTGAYTFTQLAPIDHPDVGETGAADPLRLKVGFTVTDGDGDTASNSIQIDILDDAPVVSNPTDVNLDADVLVTPDASDHIASGSLGTDWGADSGNLTTGGAPGDRAANFSNGVTADNDVTVKSSGVPVDLTSNGDAVSFDFIGSVLVGYTGSDVAANQVFTVALNDSTGSYDLTLLANLDYAGLSSAADNVIDLSFDFTVTDADGDTASGSFSVTVDDTARVRVFDADGDLVGTFGTIAEGLAATEDGYTVRILPGTYSESDLAVDHAITIIGQGDVIVNAAGGDGFVVGDAGATETVRIENIAVNNAAGSGIVLNGSTLGTLEVVDASFGNNYRNGIEVSNGANLGAALIDNSDFTNNGGTRTGELAQSSSGDGDILFFNFQGDATLSDLTIKGGTQSGLRAETAIQFRADGGGLAQGQMGTVSLTDITVSGSYEKQPIGIFNYTDIGGSADGLQMTNVTVTADSTSYQTSINFDDIGGTIDFSDTAKFNNVKVSTAPDAVSLQGTSGVNKIIGKAEAEFIHAKGGDDVVRGNGGDDIIMADGRDGSDDAGTVDTAEFSGNYADYTLTWESLDIGVGAVEGVRLVGPDGSDFVGTVEILAFDGDTAKVLIVGSGGFATIQDAVDAAQAGDTILIAAGAWTGAGNDDVTIDKPLSMVGTGDGSTAADTIIDGGKFVVNLATDSADGTVLFKNLAITDTVGSAIKAQDQTQLGTLELDGVRIEDARGPGLLPPVVSKV